MLGFMKTVVDTINEKPFFMYKKDLLQCTKL